MTNISKVSGGWEGGNKTVLTLLYDHYESIFQRVSPQWRSQPALGCVGSSLAASLLLSYL